MPLCTSCGVNEAAPPSRTGRPPRRCEDCRAGRQTHKTCGTCKQHLPIDTFHRHAKAGWQGSCKDCQRAATTAWREANPRGYLKVRLKKYGISLEEYERREQEQGGVCQLCKRTAEEADGSRLLAVDHCHVSGKVRGLLCRPCNGMLGMARDDVSLLESAIHYLKEHGS